MPAFHMTVGHALKQDEAVLRIRNLLCEAKAEFADQITDLHEDWSGNEGRFRLKVLGYHVSGTLTVRESDVEIAGDLPFAAMLFKGKIQTAIREHAKAILA